MAPKRGQGKPGSGRKSRVYSDFLKKDIIDALKRRAKEEGKTFGDVIVDIVYTNDKSMVNIRAQAANIIVSALLVKESESQITHNVTQGPTIGLPPIIERQREEEEKISVH